MLAYLDAGSASAIVTLVLGGIAGVGVALRHRWRRLLVALKLRKPLEDRPGPEPAPPAER